MKHEELIKHDGKSWGEMNWLEKSALWVDDEDKARLMKEQHEERPWVGKAFGEMDLRTKHRLANDRPALYRELRDEWERTHAG